MNSLAEVGIGINLAFGAFQGMRAGLYAAWNKRIEVKSDTVQAQLNEVTRANVSFLAVLTEDIKRDYADLSQWSTKLMVFCAFVCAICLFALLAWSALDPNHVIADEKVWMCAFLAAGPLALAALFQFALFSFASFRFDRALKKIENFLEVEGAIKAEVRPDPPTA